MVRSLHCPGAYLILRKAGEKMYLHGSPKAGCGSLSYLNPFSLLNTLLLQLADHCSKSKKEKRIFNDDNNKLAALRGDHHASLAYRLHSKKDNINDSGYENKTIFFSCEDQ